MKKCRRWPMKAIDDPLLVTVEVKFKLREKIGEIWQSMEPREQTSVCQLIDIIADWLREGLSIWLLKDYKCGTTEEHWWSGDRSTDHTVGPSFVSEKVLSYDEKSFHVWTDWCIRRTIVEVIDWSCISGQNFSYLIFIFFRTMFSKNRGLKPYFGVNYYNYYCSILCWRLLVANFWQLINFRVWSYFLAI